MRDDSTAAFGLPLIMVIKLSFIACQLGSPPLRLILLKADLSIVCSSAPRR
jgi:hypothetical protein